MARTTTARRRRGGARRPAIPAEPLVDAAALDLPPEPETPALPAIIEHEVEVPLAEPERAYAERVPPPEPERPWPPAHRIILFDVENTSRPEHISRMIEHLGIDRQGRRTDFVAVGNWRVIGSDTGRLLARHGAQLIHSAPSTGVRDWSDLRIAVTAGVWLGGARPGDLIEIVSDDRAFDAVGDVAATLGVTFRRVSYRALSGARAPQPAHAEPDAPRGRSRRRGHGRGGRGRHRPSEAAAPPPRVHAERPEPTRPDDVHSAPQDEIVDVVRELVERAPDRAVLIDTLANALKARGFRRPPGSPRLITRLRRIRDLSVSSTGMITLVGSATGAPTPAVADVETDPDAISWQPTTEVATSTTQESGEDRPRGRRRRGRRGGRRRRRQSAVPPAD